MTARSRSLTSGAIGCGMMLAATALVGCNRSGLNLASVEGVVKLDGAPVADAGVMLSPVDSSLGPPASGTTDEQGKFTLRTANQPGAVLGEHRVAISKTEVMTITQTRGLPLYKTKELIPPKYGSFNTSGQTAKIEDDDNFLEFELSSN